ncbi:MAG TPA: serine hydrolase, partial [Parasegetibacter sp.]
MFFLNISLCNKIRILVAILFTSVAISGYSQKKNIRNTELPPDIDQYIENVLSTFKIPGIGIAVVKDGKVLMAKGYGVRKLGSPERVDSKTLFPIASNTKAFTATALSLLVAEGKISWSDPVVKHLPWFRLSNPFVTNELNIKDLLVHNSGIAAYAGDLMQFPPTNFTRTEIVRKLEHLPLSASFRSTYAYDNVLYLVAGELIKAVSGMEWEDFIQTRILDKVGMTESFTRFSLFRNKGNIAASHAPVNGQVKHLESFFEQGFGDASNPAGGIVSNAEDMAKWLIVQLDSGRLGNGDRLLTSSAAAELWKGVTPMPVSIAHSAVAPAQTDFNAYALGFRVHTYRKLKEVTHGGKLDGFVSNLKLFPELGLGIMIMTNQETTNGCQAIAYYITDYIAGLPKFDWLKGYAEVEAARFRRIAEIENYSEASRDKGKGPSLSLEKYCGTYEDAWYGKVHISMENGKMKMQFAHTPLLQGELEHWHYDTFVVRWKERNLRADAYVT